MSPCSTGARSTSGGVDLDDGEVAVGIRADDLRRQHDAVGERHLQLVRAFHDVVVGDDVARGVPDEAGTRAFGHASALELMRDWPNVVRFSM